MRHATPNKGWSRGHTYAIILCVTVLLLSIIGTFGGVS